MKLLRWRKCIRRIFNLYSTWSFHVNVCCTTRGTSPNYETGVIRLVKFFFHFAVWLITADVALVSDAGCVWLLALKLWMLIQVQSWDDGCLLRCLVVVTADLALRWWLSSRWNLFGFLILFIFFWSKFMDCLSVSQAEICSQLCLLVNADVHSFKIIILERFWIKVQRQWSPCRIRTSDNGPCPVRVSLSATLWMRKSGWGT